MLSAIIPVGARVPYNRDPTGACMHASSSTKRRVLARLRISTYCEHLFKTASGRINRSTGAANLQLAEDTRVDETPGNVKCEQSVHYEIIIQGCRTMIPVWCLCGGGGGCCVGDLG